MARSANPLWRVPCYDGAVRIVGLYISRRHSYFGRHGRSAIDAPAEELDSISCVAGRGVHGDRFFAYKPDYKGQISFFAAETYDRLCGELDVHDKSPAAFRRNVITRGVDLNALIGREFEIQGLRFLGTGECKPCYWMNMAFHPQAESLLKGHGGLRAKILTTGQLKLTGQNTFEPPSNKTTDMESVL